MICPAYTRGVHNGQKANCRFRPEDAAQSITFAKGLETGGDPGQVSAMKAQDVIATYERVGAAWARQRNRNLMEKAWLDRMLTAAPRDTGAVRVLDLGCGSGKPIGGYLAERGAQLTGVDATDIMTGLYAANVPGATAIKADMRGLSLDRQFDAILAWDSFFHLTADDQRAMFATFAAHAAPGATLMFTSGHIAGEAIGDIAGAPIYHASLAPDDYKTLLADAGFKLLRFVPEDATCGGHTIWLAQFRKTPG